MALFGKTVTYSWLSEMEALEPVWLILEHRLMTFSTNIQSRNLPHLNEEEISPSFFLDLDQRPGVFQHESSAEYDRSCAYSYAVG